MVVYQESITGSPMRSPDGSWSTRTVPMQAHLALDALAGPALGAAPWLLGYVRAGGRAWLPHALVGGTEFLLALLTQTQLSYGETGQSG